MRRSQRRRATTAVSVALLVAACGGAEVDRSAADAVLDIDPVLAQRTFDADVGGIEVAPPAAALRPTDAGTARAVDPTGQALTVDEVLAVAARVDAVTPRDLMTDIPAPAADPVHLRIPVIGVDSETIHLDLTRDEAEVPESFHVAGWYRQTAEPGTVGPAVIVGHVGSRNGPGIFSDLEDLRPGDEIEVTAGDGIVRTFVVDHGELVSKYDRPANVFGRGEDRPELRLITCGGEFDSAIGHHVSNYVVWAHEEGT